MKGRKRKYAVGELRVNRARETPTRTRTKQTKPKRRSVTTYAFASVNKRQTAVLQVLQEVNLFSCVARFLEFPKHLPLLVAVCKFFCTNLHNSPVCFDFQFGTAHTFFWTKAISQNLPIQATLPGENLGKGKEDPINTGWCYEYKMNHRPNKMNGTKAETWISALNLFRPEPFPEIESAFLQLGAKVRLESLTVQAISWERWGVLRECLEACKDSLTSLTWTSLPRKRLRFGIDWIGCRSPIPPRLRHFKGPGAKLLANFNLWQMAPELNTLELDDCLFCYFCGFEQLPTAFSSVRWLKAETCRSCLNERSGEKGKVEQRGLGVGPGLGLGLAERMWEMFPKLLTLTLTFQDLEDPCPLQYKMKRSKESAKESAEDLFKSACRKTRGKRKYEEVRTYEETHILPIFACPLLRKVTLVKFPFALWGVWSWRYLDHHPDLKTLEVIGGMFSVLLPTGVKVVATWPLSGFGRLKEMTFRGQVPKVEVDKDKTNHDAKTKLTLLARKYRPRGTYVTLS